MKIKTIASIMASIFALTTFTLLAQPSLPTTNSYIVPIANPYSGSWIYYTTNAASGLNFLGGASVDSLNSASNSLSSAIVTATTGLASETFVNNAIIAATNGLASEIWVNSQINAATNGLVTAAVTNGLATTAYADSAASAAQAAATTAAESYADTKSSTLATNLQNMTWGTTTNKPAGSAPPATIYYYFTNGAPMFGIISTNQ